MKPAKIGRLGEEIVAFALEKRGYTTLLDTKQPGATDIRAQKGPARIRVQVKTSILPGEPQPMTVFERNAILMQCASTGEEPLLAEVRISSDLQTVLPFRLMPIETQG